MPYIDIKVAGKLSDDVKSAIATDVTESLHRHANKPMDATYITFTEIPRDSWAKKGQLLSSSD
ncbi:MAG: tautomerase family protein [Candidatus Marinamargulisbacteria bacterium]